MPDAKVDKQYDVEETREEQAQRLVSNKVNDLTKANKSARERFGRHVKHLTPEQRQSLVAFLRRDFEQTLGAIEDVGRDAPEFSFTPGFVDASW